jgi:hypothetical protein
MSTTRLDTPSYGLRIGIESDDAGVLAEVRQRLPLEWILLSMLSTGRT